MLLPFLTLLVWWMTALVLLYIVSRVGTSRVPLDTKYVYENLPVVYENCSGLTARHVYLLCLAYGSFSDPYFFPCAAITIRFSSRGKDQATAVLDSKMLTDNHRRYLKRQRQPRMAMLYALYKRRCPLKSIDRIYLDHNHRNGTLMVYNVFALQLADNTVFGARISKTIRSLPPGANPEMQTFNYACFGRCLDYVGPCLNLSLFETLVLLFAGVSSLFLNATAFVFCPGADFECRQLKTLSGAIQASLHGGLLAVVLTLALLLFNQIVLKRLNACWNNVGCIFVLMRALPVIVCVLCFCADITNLVLLSWPSVKQLVQVEAALSPRQTILWAICVALGATIYLLAVALLLMVLCLNGYYDHQLLPRLDFESNQVRPIRGAEQTAEAKMTTASTMTSTLSRSYSTRNLRINSKVVPKSEVVNAPAKSGQHASISQLIESTHRRSRTEKKKSKQIM